MVEQKGTEATKDASGHQAGRRDADVTAEKDKPAGTAELAKEELDRVSGGVGLTGHRR